MCPRDQFSIKYLLKNLYYYFIRNPSFSSDFPYLFYNGNGESILFTSPFYFFVISRKKNLGCRDYFLWITLLIIFGFLLFFASQGGRQFGTRYIIDVLPIIFLLLIFKLIKKQKLNLCFTFTVFASAIFHLLGVFQIRDIGY